MPLKAALKDTDACFYLQQPNYFGVIEDAAAAGGLVHAAGARYVMGVNPIAAAVLKTPRECGADIVVGGGAAPGNAPWASAGPTWALWPPPTTLPQLPGRIVGRDDRQWGTAPSS